MSPLTATLQSAPWSHPSNQSLPRHPFSSWSQVDSMKMVSVPLMERLECSRSLSISLLNKQVGIVLAVLLLQLHSVLQRISIESSWWWRLSQQSKTTGRTAIATWLSNKAEHQRMSEKTFVAAGTRGLWNIKLELQPPKSPDVNVLDVLFLRA